MDRIFSASADLSRVNPAGIALMAAGILLVMLSGSLAKWVRLRFAKPSPNAIKIVGLIICAGGALLAIL